MNRSILFLCFCLNFFSKASLFVTGRESRLHFDFVSPKNFCFSVLIITPLCSNSLRKSMFLFYHLTRNKTTNANTGDSMIQRTADRGDESFFILALIFFYLSLDYTLLITWNCKIAKQWKTMRFYLNLTLDGHWQMMIHWLITFDEQK